MHTTSIRRTSLKIALVLLACSVFGAATAPEANAGKRANRYSVVTLVNKTKFRIHYDYVWGEAKDKARQNSIPPGGTYTHWWTFRRVNENWAPFFYVQEHSRSGWAKLRSFYSPDTKSSSGREYAFFANKDASGRWTITLNPKLYTK